MSVLFKPFTMAERQLANRIAMAPLTRSRNPDGVPNDLNALYFADTPGTILPGHWYHSALANKLANTDLNLASQDMNSTFNSSIGGATSGTM